MSDSLAFATLYHIIDGMDLGICGGMYISGFNVIWINMEKEGQSRALNK